MARPVRGALGVALLEPPEDARRVLRRDRKLLRQGERHAGEARRALEVVQRVLALDRMADRALQLRRLEGDAEQDRVPAHRPAVARGERLDPFGGDVRIRRREVDVEIDGGRRSSRQRTATRAGPGRRRRSRSCAQLGGEIDEVARRPSRSAARRCSRARRPGRAPAAARRTPSSGRRAAPRRDRSGGRRPSAARPARRRAGRPRRGRPPATACRRGTARPRARSPTAARRGAPCRRAARRCRSRASRSDSAPSAASAPPPRRARDRGDARRG